MPEACADFDAGDNLPAWAAVAGPTVNGFTRNVASIFTKAVPVQTLLLLDAKDDDTYCNEAAFAETLAVHATAVDGYNSRAYWLDAYATPKAFALAQMLPVVVGQVVAPGPVGLATPNG